MRKSMALIMAFLFLLTIVSGQPAGAIIIEPDLPGNTLTIEISSVHILTKPCGEVKITGKFFSVTTSGYIDPAEEPVNIVVAQCATMSDTNYYPGDPSLWFENNYLNVIYPADPAILPLEQFEETELGWMLSSAEQNRTGIDEFNIIGSPNSPGYFFNLVDKNTDVAKGDLSKVIIGLSIGNRCGALELNLYQQKDKLLWVTSETDTLPPTPPDWSQQKPHEIILTLQAEVDALAVWDTLNSGQHNALSIELDSALTNTMLAQPLKIIQALKQFESKTTAFVSGNILEEDCGAHLIEGAIVAAQKVHDEVFIREVFSHPAFPCMPDLTEDEPIYVAPLSLFNILNGGGNGHKFEPAPDGSASRPYHSINDALDSADPDETEAVVIIVRRGVYVEDIGISHHTHIYGEPGVDIIGTISNDGPYELRIENVTIRTRTGTGTGESGGILVDNGCAKTILRAIQIITPNKYGIHQLGGVIDIRGSSITDARCGPLNIFNIYTGTGIYLGSDVIAYMQDINVLRSGRYGLVQKGGTLTLYDSDIFDTCSQAEISAAGTGIWLSDGVDAEFRSVQIYRSGSSALILEDTGTTLDAAAVFIRDTHVNSYIWENFAIYIGAVYVINGAELEMGWSVIENSEVAGLRVSGAGSTVNFHDGSVSGTIGVRGMPAGGGFLTGGINIQSRQNGYIELTSFRCNDGDLVGLQLLSGGTMDAHIGEVVGNVIGANIQTEGFDISRLTDRVIYDNERNLDSTILPIPDIAI